MKERLDKILVSKGLVKSREMAKAIVMEGKVFVDGKKITKSGTSVSGTSAIYLKEGDLPYVSRGGLKLEAAIYFFSIDLNNKIIMDVGSSTGGFTDCLLKMGARKVYCIDVGYGQLAWSLRKDPRVVVMERTNIRNLTEIVKSQKSKVKSLELEDLIKSNIDMATVDVSFISLKKVIPHVLGFLRKEGEVLALVKPQFEVGKGEVGKGGIVREEEKRVKAVKDVKEDLEKLGLKTVGIFQSPITGQKGNIEFFLYMKRGFYGRR
ncbi:MAG: TlyA family rRNA (cytidine-2'-O)-methyltransferase [Nitrospirae bacterium CG_4_10_14_0_8_um_filter_41_23]|nr:MAG: TlyA family rRNA (cytidine-2'-O)-methyltransferase [Nitrospirae bacterium CG2_30_41_42]PIQ94310.1 MAG: TlyA family rRNA (cytidine-2'-O)-methyltransferase [Nitrospirae bacterium CG11_big_fil_rev_8_21_14_0_20_41_14]PIV44185.1 MAG: TlyA family rRNA (cytidine-2'-O)-methyltransferase [Nitrospirae bacterium CG02_land_8_20_14_3_00_41_53]PIW87312.1 MAG: TlyA family rRNA (cytidine-2'-O)-methyltransferase [Nitrospirae bacterium CG_4_8_14_3_um_filter_41_47]PIY86795.1 MAG: TlyA family rRNA (cytidin